MLAHIRVPKTGSSVLAFQLQSNKTECLTDRHVTAQEFATHEHPHEFITQARDPLQLQVSAYYFLLPRVFQHSDLPPAAYGYAPQTIEMLQNRCTLEEFLTEHPGNQFMAKYWEGTDPREFLWVGLQSEMDVSIDMLNKLTTLNIENMYINVGPTAGPYNVPPAVEEVFRYRNQAEYEMYAKAVEKFKSLRKDLYGSFC